MPPRSRFGLPCAVERKRLSNGSTAFRASYDVGGVRRPRERAQGRTVALAVARLVAKLERKGFTLEASDLARAAAAQFGSSFDERVASFRRSNLPTLAQAVSENIVAASNNGTRNAQTTERMTGLLENHIKTHPIADKHLDDITRSDLEHFFADLAAKTNEDGSPLLGPTPRRSIHGLLNQTFATAVQSRDLVASPMTAIPRASKPRKAAGARFADHPQAPQVLASLARSMPYDDFLRQWPLFFALRTSERLALRHQSFAPNNKGLDALERQEATTTIRVRDQLDRGSARLLVPLKTGSSTRDLPLPLLFFAHLDALYLRRACQIVAQAQQQAERGNTEAIALLKALANHSTHTSDPASFSSHGCLNSPLFSPDTFLITSANGQPYRQQKANEKWRNLVKNHGINERIREHDLRHTAATFLASEGFSTATISAITGHSLENASTLTAVYTHSSPDDLAKALDRLACLYARPAQPPEHPLPPPLAAYAKNRPLWTLWREERAWDNPADNDKVRSDFWDDGDGPARRAAMNLWLPPALRPNPVPYVTSGPWPSPQWYCVAALNTDVIELHDWQA